MSWQLTWCIDPQGDREGEQGHLIQLQRATARWCMIQQEVFEGWGQLIDNWQASIDAHGVPLTDEALNAAKSADAVLLGAIGGPVRRHAACQLGVLD